MGIVSTGQITIIDSNDARSITAALGTTLGFQQIYTNEESANPYTPSWFTTDNRITPIISIGGLTANAAWAALTNKKFTLTVGGTAILTGTTSSSFVNDDDVLVNNPFVVNTQANGSTAPATFDVIANLKDTVGTFTLYFSATFTDPVTGLLTDINCSLALNTVRTGSNAVFISLRGTNQIVESDGITKNAIALSADLVRSSGIEAPANLTYKWYEGGGSTQITNLLGSVATKYGFKTDTTTNAPATPIEAELNVNIPTSAGNTRNTIVISERAVQDIGIYKVSITDSADKTYVAWFTVYDLSDPYDVQILSTTGDKLPNGVGSTQLSPRVFHGSAEVTPLTNWTFEWKVYSRTGARAAFIDVGKISTPEGASISIQTAGNNAVFTYGGAAYGFTTGMVIKVITATGTARFYEVLSSSGNTVTIRSPATVNTWLTVQDYPAPTLSEFVGGKLYGCTGTGTLATNGIYTTAAANAITLTGFDVDVKARIVVEAIRP